MTFQRRRKASNNEVYAVSPLCVARSKADSEHIEKISLEMKRVVYGW